MSFKFNQKKTIQAVAYLLRQAGPSKMDNYTRLLKLLYIADRESLKETGRPITGDRTVAMKHGPVLSHVLDLIRGRACDCSEWDKFIERENFEIRLLQNPGNSELCDYEINKLQEISDSYKGKDQWELIDETHSFPEWIKNDPGDSQKPIPLSDILEAVGRKGDIEKIERDAKESVAFTNFFQG